MCVEILNFQAERLKAEIDENVLLCTWTNDVGYSALSIPDPGTADRILLHRPTILCSADCTHRSCILWHANRLRGTLCTLCVRPMLLRASCCTEPPTGRVSLGTMSSHLLVAQRLNSRAVQRITNRKHAFCSVSSWLQAGEPTR